MRSLGLVLRIRFDELFGVSATRYEKNKKKKILGRMRHLVMICFAILIMGAVAYVSQNLAERGYASVLPVVSYVLGSLISLIVTILKMNEMISGNADAEYLMSMPFPSATQVLALFLMLFFWNNLYTLLFALPMGIVYGVSSGAGAGFWGAWIFGMLMTSLPTSGIAALLGMVLAVFLSMSKHRNLIHSCVSLTILTVVFLFIIHMVTGIGSVWKNGVGKDSTILSQEIITKITSNYRFARLYQNGIMEQNTSWIWLFFILSVIWYVFFVFFLSVSYQELVLALKAPMQYQTYHWKTMIPKKQKNALMKREMEQWMRSKSYLTGSLIGSIMLLIVSIEILVRGAANVEAIFGLTERHDLLVMCIPFVLCFFVGMSCTTYCSLSMEGKRHWIMETLPMEERMLKSCKMKLNLLITIPMVLVNATLLCIAFQPSILQLLLLYLISIAYAFLSAWWGFFVDSRYADYTSESERQTMYQSTSFFLGYLPGILLPILSILIINVVI